MHASFARQLEPFGFTAAIHTVGTGRGVAIMAARAVAAHQLAAGQAVAKRRVLLVTMDVIDLKMGADRERVDREDFGAALNFRKFRFARHINGCSCRRKEADLLETP